ncbi:MULTISPECIES: sensor histidine kinase [unclassified Rhizobium]|uniref:sensor histidine kinase n=1 Tax=unclassified Rhizobium TaxID=2613769 RepID=UPI0016099982|nr:MULTISPECIES: sensor histidine kinase [unclassified Rhizobium]MBB3320471.1 two-component sensor histidine kinase [Rhizobium sp. BK181]MBB3545419.1 two-component sensor histidine kinase [Rhizobium sp. BK399]
MNAAPTEGELDWVLVLAPFRKDSDYIAASLREQDIRVEQCKIEDMVRFLWQVPGVIVITHEALTPTAVANVADYVVRQPDWSEVPILVLLERSAPIKQIRTQLQNRWPGARLLFHIRPISQLELVNSIQSNLLVRLRQKQVRDSIEREVELRHELNHRIKNILASVTSIFHMTKRGAVTAEDLAGDFSGRLRALSDVHTALFDAGGDEVSLVSVIDVTVSPYNTRELMRIHTHGPDVTISRASATTIALCLHELITNSIKYGSLSVGNGCVNIDWKVSASNTPTFSLEWVEAGGPNVVAPTRQGYGTRYVRSALASLFGTAPEIVFAPQGFRFHVIGPLRNLRHYGAVATRFP